MELPAKILKKLVVQAIVAVTSTVPVGAAAVANPVPKVKVSPPAA